MHGKSRAKVSDMKNYLKGAIESKEDSGIQTALFYGPSGTGKVTAARKIAEESGALFIEVSAADGADYQTFDKALEEAAALAQNKKHVVVLIKDVDKITDPRIHYSIHYFLNRYAQKLKYICTILTATNHHKYQDQEKAYITRVRFDLPTISEKNQFIISQLKKYNRHLSNLKITLIAASSRNFSCEDLANLLKNGNNLVNEKKHLPFFREYLLQILTNKELRNNYAFNLCTGSLIIFGGLYFHKDIAKILQTLTEKKKDK